MNFSGDMMTGLQPVLAEASPRLGGLSVPLICAVLLVVAFFTKIDAFFYLLYSLFGILVLGRLWARRSLAAVSLRRVHDHRVFLDRPFTVDVEVRNGSWLPVLWMRLGDAIPPELSRGNVFRQVVQ